MGHSGRKSLAQQHTVALAQAADHAEIQENDFPFADPDIALVRVRMEKSIVQYLLGIIFGELPTDFFDVVARFLQLLQMVDGDAMDAFHHKDALSGQAAVDLGAGHIDDVFVPFREFLVVVGLQQEIHLLLGDAPHFVDHGIKVEHIHRLAHAHQAKQADGLVHQFDVQGHGVVNAGALHLDDHVLMCFPQGGAVDLGDRGAAQRRRIDP